MHIFYTNYDSRLCTCMKDFRKYMQHLYLYGSVTMLYLGCDRVLCFWSKLEVEIVKNMRYTQKQFGFD